MIFSAYLSTSENLLYATLNMLPYAHVNILFNNKYIICKPFPLSIDYLTPGKGPRI